MIQITVNDGLHGAPKVGFTFSFSLYLGGASLPLKELMNKPGTKENRLFECVIECNSERRHVKGIRGDSALWLPLGDGYGLKIILDGKHTQLENLGYLQERQSPIFPRIEWAALGTLKEANEHRSCIVTRMEEVSETQFATSSLKGASRLIGFIHRIRRGGRLTETEPEKEKGFGASALLQCPLTVAESCAHEFSQWKLLPEDEWYKPTNLISGKIVDCHNFEFMPNRYAFPVGNASLSELQELYRTGPRSNRKGTLYQGFKFANGYSMPGYSSDGVEFDTYSKLPFLPLRKVKNGRILDLGCAQGFFSFQAMIHGATEVVALDRNPENLVFARQLNATCFGFDKINFVEDDVERFIVEHRCGDVDVVFLLSVLHQMYPNMQGADPFLARLASMARFVAFETAVAHPQMSLSLEEIFAKLEQHFRIVRLLYTYDAYSSGYRAIFILYGLGK